MLFRTHVRFPRTQGGCLPIPQIPPKPRGVVFERFTWVLQYAQAIYRDLFGFYSVFKVWESLLDVLLWLYGILGVIYSDLLRFYSVFKAWGLFLDVFLGFYCIFGEQIRQNLAKSNRTQPKPAKSSKIQPNIAKVSLPDP